MRATTPCPACKKGRLTISDEAIPNRTSEGSLWLNCGSCGLFQGAVREPQAPELDAIEHLGLTVRALLRNQKREH